MATIDRVEELEIWQLARKLAKEVRVVLKQECFRYEFGLKEQMKNASGSVMDNIAEGFGRGSKHEFINSLTIAQGSLQEIRSQIYRCHDAEMMKKEAFDSFLSQSESLTKRITALINYLNRTPIKGPKFKNRQ